MSIRNLPLCSLFLLVLSFPTYGQNITSTTQVLTIEVRQSSGGNLNIYGNTSYPGSGVVVAKR